MIQMVKSSDNKITYYNEVSDPNLYELLENSTIDYSKYNFCESSLLGLRNAEKQIQHYSNREVAEVGDIVEYKMIYEYKDGNIIESINNKILVDGNALDNEDLDELDINSKIGKIVLHSSVGESASYYGNLGEIITLKINKIAKAYVPMQEEIYKKNVKIENIENNIEDKESILVELKELLLEYKSNQLSNAEVSCNVFGINSEIYDFYKERNSYVISRIQEIANELNINDNYSIDELFNYISKGQIGDVFTYSYINNCGESFIHSCLLYDGEVNPKLDIEQISVKSPLGKVLLNSSIGTKGQYDLYNNISTITVLDIVKNPVIKEKITRKR